MLGFEQFAAALPICVQKPNTPKVKEPEMPWFASDAFRKYTDLT